MKDDWTPGCNVKVDVPDDQKGRHYDVFEEVALMLQHLRKHGVLSALCERVRFRRRRFGHYEVIDFLAILFGYAERRRTHAGSFLRETPALRSPFHGLV